MLRYASGVMQCPDLITTNGGFDRAFNEFLTEDIILSRSYEYNMIA